MKKLVFFILLLKIGPVFSQDRIDSLLNDLLYDQNDPLLLPAQVNFDFFYLGTNFNSNSFYAGREIGTDISSISENLFYYNSWGFFIGESGSMYNQLDPAFNNLTFSMGFSKPIDKKKMFSFRTSYSRFIYFNSDSASYYPYKNNLNMGLSFRKGWFGIRAGGNLLFGDENRINLTSSLYSRFNLLKLGQHNKLYSNPEFSAFFTTETISTTKIDPLDMDQILNYSDRFGLLNSQLYLPLGVTLGNFDLEFSYSLNFPITRDVNISYPVTSFYSISLEYILPFTRKIK